ncbi:hypothetical protein [Corynebacterium coyleae]|uniref:Uncharacterized protein n=1 Tax=Corynebacterium coyleae TaxID=53374 RepID=A0ABX8KWN7_9CORY|nr:hypothetical protein [Corynebacterium coyleae]QXB18345.1 hypothetical protein I6L55_10805 [Corynebacterium coyleae]
MFQQKQAVKSPIPNQKQTNQHHKQMLDWQNKIQKLPEAKKLPTNPHPDGAKTRVGNMHHALTKMKHTTQMIRQSMVHPTTTGTHQTRHAHHGTQHQAHNNKKCIGTLSSSQTTPAHPTTTTFKVTAV